MVCPKSIPVVGEPISCRARLTHPSHDPLRTRDNRSHPLDGSRHAPESVSLRRDSPYLHACSPSDRWTGCRSCSPSSPNRPEPIPRLPIDRGHRVDRASGSYLPCRQTAGQPDWASLSAPRGVPHRRARQMTRPAHVDRGRRASAIRPAAPRQPLERRSSTRRPHQGVRHGRTPDRIIQPARKNNRHVRRQNTPSAP